jgi:hypothetical protein
MLTSGAKTALKRVTVGAAIAGAYWALQQGESQQTIDYGAQKVSQS